MGVGVFQTAVRWLFSINEFNGFNSSLSLSFTPLHSCTLSPLLLMKNKVLTLRNGKGTRPKLRHIVRKALSSLGGEAQNRLYEQPCLIHLKLLTGETQCRNLKLNRWK